MNTRDIRFTDIPVSLPGGLVVIDEAGRVVDADEKGWRLLGGTQFKGQRLADWALDGKQKVDRYLAMCRRNSEAVPGRMTTKGADNDEITFAVRGARMRDGDAGYVCLYLEGPNQSNRTRRFTALNQTIDRLRLEIKSRLQMEAILEAQKHTLASVFQGAGLRSALEILARAVEANSDGMLVSILLVDEGALRHQVAPSLPAEYVTAIDGVAIGADIGSCGTAAYTGETVIASDIETDPRWQDFKAAALAADLHACWSSPILSSDQTVLGTFALYFRTPREPVAEELQLIANSAYVAGVAIERFRSQQLLSELLEGEQRAREEAEAQNRAKDEFLAMLGHELRNPLGAITNAALALDASIEPTNNSSEFLQMILSESGLLKRILDDLLDMSRLSRGKLRLQIEPIDMDLFVLDLINAVRAVYPAREIGFDIQADLGAVIADPSRLRQSLLNLVDNAVKYSSDGDEISVSVQANAEEVWIKITDTGQGIEDQLMDTIFEPFVQSDASIARTNSGLGLGLALVKRFAVMHGGDVSVVSAGVDQGSEFTFTIPRECTDSAAAVPVEIPATNAKRYEQVLVVEDNDNARAGLCELLRLWGLDVIPAADGQQALDILQQARPDIALLDIGLPLVDGYAVAKAIRANPAVAAMTLVALTGYGQDRDRERATEAGFDHHVVKPADLNDLIKVFGPPGQIAEDSYGT